MSFSLSRRQPLDPAEVGIAREVLPEVGQGRVDVREFFPEPGRPVDLEIGSGKGTFLVQQAAANPGVNYLGIEYARAFWRYAADRARRHNLPNVRLINMDAAVFVKHMLPDKTLRQVHIYFPDPWPKKRHHKRRLIQAPFLAQLHRVLVDPAEGDAEAGQVRIATDHAEYFEWMLEHFGQVEHLFERQPFVRPDSAGEGELVGTNFERKYRREGRPFNAVILRKIVGTR